MDRVYLKENVLAEPLFNQWYAWSYLISPHTAAMYIANLHLKIMQSFIASPQVHINAHKTPAMMGGPFINHDVDRVSYIKALLERTIDKQQHMLRLAESIQELDKMLVADGTGYSLEPLYQKMPDALKGYVELVYDLNNNPSIRFIEGLLYRSPYYDPSCQSLMLSLIDGDNRSFVFSTPRLEDENHFHLKVPFNHEGLDELFKMKFVPQSYDFIKQALGIGNESDEMFRSFFTEQSPQQRAQHSSASVRVRYFGHACVLVESEGCNVLCDPVISYKVDGALSRYTYADLPEVIDYALITHNHQDHCMFETLLQLRHRIKNIIVPRSNGGGLADQSLKLALRNTGFENVTEIDEMETIDVPAGIILGLPFLGEHADLNIRTKTAYLIKLQEKSVVCAADSNNIDPTLYEHIHEATGDVDVLFLGMECNGAPLTWLYGPLLSKPLSRKMDQSRRFNGSNFERGIQIVNQLNPKQVYVYAMGQEPWLTYLTSIRYTEESRPIIESNKLVEECARRGLVAERLFGMKDIIIDQG